MTNGDRFDRDRIERARRRRSRSRLHKAVAALCVAAVVSVGAAWGLGAFAPQPAQDEQAGDAPSQDAGAQGAQGSGDAQASGDQTNAEDDRAADFAVDPAKQTEWRTKTDGTKTIWLTFDDGPSANTEKVLDILDRYGVKATFFVTNEEPQYASMIKEAYDRGNTIGLHSYTHEYSIYASEDSFFNDLDQIGAVVKDQIGYVPCFIRFPGGASNTVSAKYCRGIMTKLTQDVQARGYQYFDWNISCGDGAAGHTADELAAYATDDADYSNVMLLMHDSAGHEATVDALPAIIEHYQQEGYTFKAIDRTALASHQKVNN